MLLFESKTPSKESYDIVRGGFSVIGKNLLVCFLK